MSRAKEDLMKLMYEMNQGFKDDPSPSEKPKPQAAPARSWSDDARNVLLVAGVGASAATGFIGLALGSMPAVILGLAGSSACTAWVLLLWKQAGSGAGDSSDVAVEIIKRRTLEMERDRLRQELEKSYHSIQKLSNEVLELRESLQLHERTQRGSEQWMEHKKLLEAEIQRLQGQLKDSMELGQKRESSMGDEMLRLRQALSHAEDQGRKLGSEVIRLKGELDRQVSQLTTETSERLTSQSRAFEEERKVLHKRIEEQEHFYQSRLGELETQHAAHIKDMEAKLEEITSRALKLQEQAEASVASSSGELEHRVEEIRRNYEAQKEAMLRKASEQETHYRQMLEDQERRFNSQKAELLAACEALLKELETQKEPAAQK